MGISSIIPSSLILGCFILHQMQGAHCISGGHKTTISRHPWQLSLHYKDTPICGAVLISSKWGLTSAKCVAEKDSGLSIRAGSSYADKGGKTFQVKKAHISPDYDEETLEANIALLEFNEDVEDSDEHRKYATLTHTDKELSEEISIDLTGWGQTDANGTSPKQLQFAQIYAITRDKCRDLYSYDEVAVDMMCGAGYGTVTACEGDFGGPCIAQASIFGILSWGRKCGDSEFPVVCTRTFPYNKWISKVSGINITSYQ